MSMHRFHSTSATVTAAACALAAVLTGSLAHAQAGPPGRALAPDAEKVTLTLGEAIEIGLARNYALRDTRLDVADADAQVEEARGEILPDITLSGSYTRNIVTANPFAGSDISGFLGGGNVTEWLAFNERARQDDDPATEPISLAQFQQLRQQGLEQAGVVIGDADDDPFSVENQFFAGIQLTQTLYDGAAFAAIEGAETLKEVNESTLTREQQVVVDQVRTAFYQALLAKERARVAEQSVERTRETVEEVTQRVTRGVAPEFEQLSSEVELANLETELVQARNRAGRALDDLKLTLGFPVEQPIELRGALEAEDPAQLAGVSADEAVAEALEQRADVTRARQAIRLRRVQQDITESQRWPRLSAVANFDYTGRVPDDRSFVFSPDPTDPFTFKSDSRGFFADPYWNPAVSVGLQLQWTLFDGFQRRARIEQDQVAIRRAKLQYEQLRQEVRLEVQSALRDLEAARQRIQAQAQNVDRAELNYEYANKRVAAGASTQLELREASEQLDQSRLNYLQAIYDYLVARSGYETAVGAPGAAPSDTPNL